MDFIIEGALSLIVLFGLGSCVADLPATDDSIFDAIADPSARYVVGVHAGPAGEQWDSLSVPALYSDAK